MSKQLQADSKYAVADTDGDGIITDEELDRHERWIRLENEDKMMDTQRTMAWLAMGTTIVTVVLLLTPIINIPRMESASGFLNTFLVAQMGVVLGFMGASALSKTKAKGQYTMSMKKDLELPSKGGMEGALFKQTYNMPKSKARQMYIRSMNKGGYAKGKSSYKRK